MPARKRSLADDTGSAPVEFVLVGLLLTALTLGVIQLGVAVYVRNVVHDAAITGAHQAALADETVGAGVDRTRELIRRAIGAAYAGEITGRSNADTVEMVVRAPLPVIGLWGPAGAMEVRGHAPRETLE
ncbi:TadE/TadG family type IV pilus assembly protein [Microbacterium sp. X-17]|uniref:TadE/TadG family type IV pilus assembly protein n=1 Tax=Microbacterium sp. X-17 TaxID=3144404 RepID=UPI0031F5DA4E